MKNILKYTGQGCIGFVLLLLASCSLDYENTGTINPTNVWSDKKMIDAFLTDIHGSMMPGWAGGGSDESINSKGANMDNYLRGILDVEAIGKGYEFGYTNIDKINFFLTQIAGVSSSVVSDLEKDQMKGQALFWRAWDYWHKVRNIGGVPLILEVQDLNNKESLFIPRNKTSECVAQIIKDLDDAITYLPDGWDNSNYGRIDKGAAMAFKGCVLLWYASPLFNTTNNKDRWEEAYTANKQAVDHLTSVGKGLHGSYKTLWSEEQNKEVIMVNQFYYPDHAFNQSAIRPDLFGQGSGNDSQPIAPLLSAFPKKDGTPLTLDVNKLKDPVYNRQYFDDFITNRDDRFYTTIFLGGTKYPSTDVIFAPDESYWQVWVKSPDASKPNGYIYNSLVAVQNISGGINFGVSGFFQIKGIDPTLNKSIVTSQAKTDWVEIRYAEVLMNYGECANELGKNDEALDVLYKIRDRAGISSGNGKYGITATNKEELREVYINERFVEFAFEGKRWGDLRRWKRFDILNNHKHRSGIYVTLNENIKIEKRDDFDWTDNIYNPKIRDMFHIEFIENLDGSNEFLYNLNLNHWFYPIARKDLERNSKLEQNNEWGGTFDPLL